VKWADLHGFAYQGMMNVIAKFFQGRLNGFLRLFWQLGQLL
jgi:hypothetical protein